ncbi:ras-like protein [Anaeramoeba flamelloides]|uniref:Ras-like protein n=1 Tax=Anaeramoeba flamelloides TaxID=1746091 RepID=A0ABQ8X3I6_9EUKA|nr:ras-like protein [Anaeramoeba flamelloides]
MEENKTTIVVMGSGSVGKSALTIQFLQNHFLTSYDPTIEECYRRQIIVDQKSVYLNIIDTAGQEEFSSMRQINFIKGEGFLFVYSIIDYSSFHEIPDFITQLQRSKDGDEYGMVIVGNKNDLENERMVKVADGEKLAQDHNCTFIETSAKTRANVEEAFFNCIKEVQKNKERSKTKQKNKRKRKSCNIL